MSGILKPLFSRLVPRNIYAARLDALVNHLLKDSTFHFLDVGAQGGLPPRWSALGRFLEVTAVDPHGLDYNVTSDKQHIGSPTDPATDHYFSHCRSFYPIQDVLGTSNSKKDFHHTADSRLSSLLTPNYEFLKYFPNKERFDIKRVEKITTKSIDSIAVHDIDFIKIDVQGAEALVLEGARESLQRCVGIEVEVEFLELYQGQPLFGNIAESLREQGFIFHDFTNLCRWNRKTLYGDGQCVFGDALFIRDFDQISFETHFSDVKLIALIIVLLVYRRFDIFEKFLEGDHFLAVSERMNLDRKFIVREAKKLIHSHRRVLRVGSKLSNGLGYMGSGYYTHLMY